MKYSRERKRKFFFHRKVQKSLHHVRWCLALVERTVLSTQMVYFENHFHYLDVDAHTKVAAETGHKLDRTNHEENRHVYAG